VRSNAQLTNPKGQTASLWRELVFQASLYSNRFEPKWLLFYVAFAKDDRDFATLALPHNGEQNSFAWAFFFNDRKQIIGRLHLPSIYSLDHVRR
jgi:hypothetical protein